MLAPMTDTTFRSRTARATRPGGTDVIEVSAGDVRPLGAGEVLVKVEVANLNHADSLIRSGEYAVKMPFPYDIGLEGAGTVEAVGEGVTLAPGTRVCWTGTPGTCGEYVVAKAMLLTPIVDGLGFDEAGRLAHAGLTAGLLARVWPLSEGQRAVIWGAAGAVGRILTATLAARGVEVIGIASGARVEPVLKVGAAHAIDRASEDVVGQIMDITGGAKVNAVYDPVAAETFTTSLKLLAPRGCLINYGELSGPVAGASLHELFTAGGVFITKFQGEAWVESPADFPALVTTAQELAAEQPAVLTEVSATFPLEQAAEAYRLMEEGVPGKVLVHPWA